ncbi:MAG: hypothetical protein MUO21_12190, partial [Nitrososphaeraceae archaeon]|nr:hypothetical protein [Nitrososphaeraceae archaeon]
MDYEPQSCFDKSVCCLCTQSIWKKLAFSQILTTLLIMSALTGCLCNVAVYCTPSLIGSSTETAGLCLHFVSFIGTLIFTSYFGRYISGLQHARNDDFDTRYCCDGYYYYCCLGYILCGLYALFTLVFYACIAGEYDNGRNIVIINQYSKGITMYYSSAIIMWYWIVVFKPFIPNICNSLNMNSNQHYLFLTKETREENEKNTLFVRIFTNYLFFENEQDIENYGIWSTVSLLLQFCFSVLVMNFSFAVY